MLITKLLDFQELDPLGLIRTQNTNQKTTSFHVLGPENMESSNYTLLNVQLVYSIKIKQEFFNCPEFL